MSSTVLPGLAPRPVHGGNLKEICQAYGFRQDEVIDFSSNINPAGPPPAALARLAQSARDARALADYPEADCFSLSHAIAQHLMVDPHCIIVANGSAAMLDIAMRALRPTRCLLPIPAFSEYARALCAAGVQCDLFRLRPEDDFEVDSKRLLRASDERGSDLWILTNPHNPSGSAISTAQLLALLATARDRKVSVLLDEAFVDYSPELSISKIAAAFENLVVLRSLTKFYGLAGLRVGYAVASLRSAEHLRLQVPSWPVSGLAIAAAIEALADAGYAKAALSALNFERDWLAQELHALGLRVFPSFANFLLVRLPPGGPSATALRHRLIAQCKMVIRDCSSYQGLEDGTYFRISVREHAANGRFLLALKETLQS